MTCPPCNGTGYRHYWRTSARISEHRERCRLCKGFGWYETGCGDA